MAMKDERNETVGIKRAENDETFRADDASLTKLWCTVTGWGTGVDVIQSK